MSVQMVLEDAVVLIFLWGIVLLAAESMRRRLIGKQAQHDAFRRSTRFKRFFFGYIVALTVSGGLHQSGFAVGWVEDVWFAVLVGIGITAWIRWQRIPTSKEAHDVR